MTAQTMTKAEAEKSAALNATSERLTKAETAASGLGGQVAAAEKRVLEHQQQVDEARLLIYSARGDVQDAKLRIESLKAFLDYCEKAVESSDNEAIEVAYDELNRHSTRQFAIAAVEPLTAEQMAWSIMTIGGLFERQRAAEEAALNKKTPFKPEEQNDEAKVAERARQVEDATYKKLDSNVAKFIKLFAAGAGQPQHDFFATVDQALFFANGGEIRSWLAPNAGNLTERLANIEEDTALAEEMYLGILTRRPTVEEIADVSQYLASRPDEKNGAIQEMVWALVTSTEFRFHH